MEFSGQTVLITGAAAGIGRATAVLFAKQGASVVLVDMNYEKLESVKQEIFEYTDKVLTYVCDVSDETRVNEVVALACKEYGQIDILVNNAALWRSFSSFNQTDIEVWKKFIDVNIMGTVYFTKAVIDKMIKNNYGRIINVASIAGVYGNANMSHYSATKGAVISFTKALAKEVADKGITVNAVSPGSVSPSENSNMDYSQNSELCFIGRTGTAMENAELICFLASDKAGYISGQNIQIDGCRKKL